MNDKKGFTLIELVIVIVILGVLAITAAPKFLNLQDDARNATLKALNGTINSAIQVVYGKAAIKGIENEETGIVNGINVIYGYPEATYENMEKLIDGLGLSDSPWVVYIEEKGRSCGVNGCLFVGYPEQDLDNFPDACLVGYFNAGFYDSEFFSAKSYFSGESCGGVAPDQIDHFVELG